MAESRKPSLRVVGADEPTQPKLDPSTVFDDLDRVRYRPPEPIEDVPSAKPRRRLTRSAKKEDPFSRTWFSWFAEERWQAIFPPLTRLWMVLWYRSREGSEPVQITQLVAREARIPLSHRRRYARRLERLGMVRIEQQPGKLLLLHITVQKPG